MLIALVRCRLHAGKLLALILPGLASVAALLGFCHAVYGGFSPAAISALPEHFSHWASLSWRRSATYLCALFLDSQGGVIAYAPALLLAPLGAALLYRRDRRLMCDAAPAHRVGNGADRRRLAELARRLVPALAIHGLRLPAAGRPRDRRL